MQGWKLLLGLAVSASWIPAADAEEPPDDVIVQETLAKMDREGFILMTQPVGPQQAGTVYASRLLEAELWVRSERLSRGNVEVYEVNRQIPGVSNMIDAQSQNRELFMIDGDDGGLGSVAEYVEVVDVDIGGQQAKYGRILPPDEVERRRLDASAVDPAELARAQALGSLVVGELLRRAAKDSPLGPLIYADAMDAEGIGIFMNSFEPVDCPGLLDDMRASDMEMAGLQGATRAKIEPWTSINPLTFMTGHACFLLAGAEAIEGLGSVPPDTARQISSAIERARQGITYSGTDTVDGRPTHKLQANNLNLRQVAADQTVTINKLQRWIDAEYLVPRKLRLEGVMRTGEESRDFFLEKLEQDYRNVPDSHLYEPYRTVLRMGGMLTPEQQAEMREAQGKLDEFERRMAAMPASQRAMTERMLGDKLQQWRSLANGGAFEVEIITTNIVINPDFSARGSTLTLPSTPEASTTTAALSPEELRAAQLACLQARTAAAQQAGERRRGLGRQTSAIGRTAVSLGGSSIGRIVGDLFDADATGDDLVAAARDLGLTEDDAAACQQP